MLGIKSYFNQTKEGALVQKIASITTKYNIDNISRTHAYLHYYTRNPEVQWAFLASQVSRNAGWSMCDLQGKWLSQVLKTEDRIHLFLAYEKANWLIFQDAFPQLLLYEYSTKNNAPLFHLFDFFQISSFMENEWHYFWQKKDKKRLLNSLIINEQNVIEKPFIQNKKIKDKVLHSIPYRLQDLFHFSAVLFPTLNGELYGLNTSHFTSVHKRIQLGNQLSSILFHPSYYQEFYLFAQKVTHTGSRRDYERFVFPNKKNTTPMLRMAYPVVIHRPIKREDWHRRQVCRKSWRKTKPFKEKIVITNWYRQKQESLIQYIKWEKKIRNWLEEKCRNVNG